MHELDPSVRVVGTARYPSLCQFATGTNLGASDMRALDSSKMVLHRRRAPWFVRVSKNPVITHAFTAYIDLFWQLASHSK
ncbi:unnamed protein product [Lasius platythorax]|uniref:Uncharacterized protein n=1 Tax=Lasius platythorax TaxID=488582 RepID=A0AAV2NXN1_9HYME